MSVPMRWASQLCRFPELNPWTFAFKSGARLGAVSFFLCSLGNLFQIIRHSLQPDGGIKVLHPHTLWHAETDGSIV